MYQFSQTLQAALAAGTPQRVLIEFIAKPDGTAYSPVRQFSNEDILISNGVRLSEEFNPETDLTIGLCTSAEIQFDMLNDESQLADFEFGTFKAYLGARIDSGTPALGAKTKTFTEGGATATYEFAPLGTFIARRPDIVRKTVISVDANDQMTLFDVNMPDATALGITYSSSLTLSDLAQAMCAYVGVSLQTNSWLNSQMVVSKEPKTFESATMRDVLGWIAETACANARFNRDGTLEFAWFSVVAKTYDENNYADFTPTWYETQAIDGLHVRNADSTKEYTYGAGTNAYLIQDNPFLRQDDSTYTTERTLVPGNFRLEKTGYCMIRDVDTAKAVEYEAEGWSIYCFEIGHDAQFRLEEMVKNVSVSGDTPAAVRHLTGLDENNQPVYEYFALAPGMAGQYFVGDMIVLNRLDAVGYAANSLEIAFVNYR